MTPRTPVVIVPYSPDWPGLFEQERGALAALWPEGECTIEHIGSTAVPALAAKSIIDVMLGAGSLTQIEARITAFERLGYEYMPQHESVLPLRRFFARPVDRPQTFHVHAVEFGGPFWKEHVAFRNALRADGELRNRYAALKIRLAAQFGDDRDGYTDAKGPFILSVVRG